MATYFDHDYVSNSDLKGLVALMAGHQQPENIQEIYDLGTEFHAGILEPHKFTRRDDMQIIRMHNRFFEDKMCRDFIMMPDFRREHEYYRENRFGLKVRMKADGESRILNTGLELKGLGVTTEKAFHEALTRFDYDQGLAFYMDTANLDQWLLVAISKKNPKLMFKVLVDRDHPYYLSGIQKVHKKVKAWKLLSVDGQNLV